MRLLALLFFMITLPAWGASLKVVPSTPDIVVAITAPTTLDFVGGPIDWIAIKNDGPGDVYLDLRGLRDAQANEYPIKLEDGESMLFVGRVHSVGITAAASNTANALITVFPARY